MNDNAFEIVFMNEAEAFLNRLPVSAKMKILYNINRIMKGERNVELFKKLENSDIWEFRTLYNGIAYRLFSFWDKDAETLVIATHGIIKKTQKTPSKEIAKAEAIKNYILTTKRDRIRWKK